MNSNFVDILNNITEKSNNFTSAQPNYTNEIRSFVKDVYDFVKNEEDNSSKTNSLPELIVDNFDLEQIWQQVELQNEDFLSKSVTNVSKFVVSKNRLVFKEISNDLPPDKDTNCDRTELNIINSGSEMEDESDDEPDINSNNESNEDDELIEEENTTENKHRANINKKPGKPSIVDDEFFKLDEMEEFLRAEEKTFDKTSNNDSGNDSDSKDEEEVDYFKSGSESDDDDNDDVDDDKNEKNPKYKDFFGSNEETELSTRRKSDEGEQDELIDEEIDTEPKSTFEQREENLKNKIKRLENIAMSDKPWQLLGEITAENRPQNSLLEEVVEFDLVSRPAPVITEKTTFQLEDTIRQRIKDRVFDSVERKQRPVENLLEYKKKLVMDQEKSKKSLAQIYEEEYLQQKEALTGNSEDQKEEEEPELHKEIKKMTDKLFRQLDALSNYHFTPKPAAPELKIISNLPAINMEEVAPVAVSDATLLAPEEVKGRIKGDIIGKNERTDADKNRERRKKRLKQRAHANEKKKKEKLLNKINPGLGNKYSKEDGKRQLEKVIKEKNVDKMDESSGSKGIKSSSDFFKQLEEVRSQIKEKMHTKKQKVNSGYSAKKLKL